MDTLAGTVRLPPEIKERLRAAAYTRRISQSSIVVRAVRELLDRLDAEDA